MSATCLWQGIWDRHVSVAMQHVIEGVFVGLAGADTLSMNGQDAKDWRAKAFVSCQRDPVNYPMGCREYSSLS